MDVKALLCPSCGGALDPDARACPHCASAVLARRCAACFDLNLVDDRNCRRCGALLPEEDPAALPERAGCPGCGARMTSRTAGGASFLECDHCGGLWLTPGAVEEMGARAETRALLGAFDPPAPAPPRATASGLIPAKMTYRKCPVCSKLMNRTSYALGAGVVMDVCKNHGAYFDRGELTRIFTFIENGGMEKARRREAEALKAELRDLRRRAISSGGADSPLPLEFEPAPTETTIFDLLRRVASHWLAGR